MTLRLLLWTIGFLCQEIMLTEGGGLGDLVVMPVMIVPQLVVCAWILHTGRVSRRLDHGPHQPRPEREGLESPHL